MIRSSLQLEGLTQREPRHDNVGQVVDELNVQEDHADDVVTRSVHASEMHERVDGGSEGTVQPTTTLTDELGSTFGHVSLTL